MLHVRYQSRLLRVFTELLAEYTAVQRHLDHDTILHAYSINVNYSLLIFLFYYYL